MKKDKSIKIKEKQIDVNARDYMFDHVKAFLIFSVVIAHYFRANYGFTLSSFGGVVYLISFSYIMQGFLFVSGFFSQNVYKCRKTAFQTFLFPYLILMPIMYGVRIMVFGSANLDMTLPTMALWYLLTLFFYRFALADLVKIPYVLPISIVVSLVAGCISFLDVSLSSGRTFGFLPFYLMGYYFKKEWFNKIRSINKIVPVLVLIGLIFLSVYLAYEKPIPLNAFYYKTSYGATGLDNLEGAVSRVILSVISLAWIYVMVSLAPSGKSIWVSVGQNTMVVYVLHIIIRYLIKGNNGYFGQDSFSMAILAAAAILSVWIFSRSFIVKIYQGFMNFLYYWIISYPLIFIRKKL